MKKGKPIGSLWIKCPYCKEENWNFAGIRKYRKKCSKCQKFFKLTKQLNKSMKKEEKTICSGCKRRFGHRKDCPLLILENLRKQNPPKAKWLDQTNQWKLYFNNY